MARRLAQAQQRFESLKFDLVHAIAVAVF